MQFKDWLKARQKELREKGFYRSLFDGKFKDVDNEVTLNEKKV